MYGNTRPPSREASLAKGAFHTQSQKTSAPAVSIGSKRAQKLPCLGGVGCRDLPSIQGQISPEGALVGHPGCAYRPVCNLEYSGLRNPQHSGVLVCLWAPILPLFIAPWPAHSPQLHTKHQQPQLAVLKKAPRRPKDNLCAFRWPCGIQTFLDHAAGKVGEPQFRWRGGKEGH